MLSNMQKTILLLLFSVANIRAEEDHRIDTILRDVLGVNLFKQLFEEDGGTFVVIQRGGDEHNEHHRKTYKLYRTTPYCKNENENTLSSKIIDNALPEQILEMVLEIQRNFNIEDNCDSSSVRDKINFDNDGNIAHDPKDSDWTIFQTEYNLYRFKGGFLKGLWTNIGWKYYKKAADNKNARPNTVAEYKAAIQAHMREVGEASTGYCSICSYLLSEGVLRTLTCEHTFHEDCVDKWLKEKNTCPRCLSGTQKEVGIRRRKVQKK